MFTENIFSTQKLDFRRELDELIVVDIQFFILLTIGTGISQERLSGLFLIKKTRLGWSETCFFKGQAQSIHGNTFFLIQKNVFFQNEISL